VRDDLLAAVAAEGMRAAGSVLSVPARLRRGAGAALVARGAAVHADVIDSTFPLKEGVAVADDGLADFADQLDVHVMARSATAVAPSLGRPFKRLTVHVTPAANAASRSPSEASEYWISVDPTEWTDDELEPVLDRHRPDGVLLMTAPAGTPGVAADPERLRHPVVRRLHGRFGLGVDGGIRAEHLPLCAASGIDYVVIGRALFEERSVTDRH
jgi:pentose-5-phosphate-3-epimerase